MTAPAGTITYQTVVTVTAGNGTDATTIANSLNGVTLPRVSIASTATATASSSTVTISWPTSNVLCAVQTVADLVTAFIAAEAASLTASVTAITVAQSTKIT